MQRVSLINRNVNELVHLSINPQQWETLASQRAFMNALRKKLNVTDQEGMYRITNKILRQHGGHRLILHYNSSPAKLLTTIYPEYLVNS